MMGPDPGHAGLPSETGCNFCFLALVITCMLARASGPVSPSAQAATCRFRERSLVRPLGCVSSAARDRTGGTPRLYWVLPHPCSVLAAAG